MTSVTALEEAILELRDRKIDMTNVALVGTYLRDEFQIPSVKDIVHMRLSKYLEIDPKTYERARIEGKYIRLVEHCTVHKKDVPGKRARIKRHLELAKLNSEKKKGLVVK